MLEHCEICLAPAPTWEEPEYLEWHLGVDREDSYLGVVCPGCFAGEEIVFLRVESEEAIVLELASRRRPAGQADDGMPHAA
jgi:hypothetical protein